jgi:BTB And C-terminal Kelch
LELETKEALDSQDWLKISSESILEFLNMECLNIKEADLVRALIRWGKFQEQHGRGGENLRSKILPGLRKIRFDSVTQQEFVQLFQEELGVVLSDGEKSSIFMSTISGNWELMPKDVVPSIKLAPRHEPYTFYSLPYAADTNKNQTSCGNKYGVKCLVFKVQKNATIEGVKLNLNAPYHKLITFSLNHYHGSSEIATGSVNITSLHRGEVFCPFNTAQTLDANSWYRVYFKFNGFDESSFHCGYVLPKVKNPSVCDCLSLTISNSSTLCVHILGIVFSKAV